MNEHIIMSPELQGRLDLTKRWVSAAPRARGGRKKHGEGEEILMGERESRHSAPSHCLFPKTGQLFYWSVQQYTNNNPVLFYFVGKPLKEYVTYQ